MPAKKKTTFKRRKAWKPSRPLKAGTIVRGTDNWRSQKTVGIPPGIATVLRNAWFMNVDTAITGRAQFALNLGSAFNPGAALYSGQAPGWDQFTAIWQRYLVTGGYMKIEICKATNQFPTANTTFRSFVTASYPSLSGVPVADYQDAASQEYAICHSATPNNKVVHYRRFDHGKLIGLKTKIDSDTHGATITANPTPGRYAIENFFIQNNEAAIAQFQVLVEIVQDVWFDQKIPIIDI